MQLNDVLALQLFDTPDSDIPTECVSNISGCASNVSSVQQG